MRVELSDEELALIVEALEDNARLFDVGAVDPTLDADERAVFAVDAELCRLLVVRLRGQ